mmetsp:Transcript_14566/g.16157  ORF Transcript_14566/g.16157 Transcript_14566/m.16157 type:complete len:214 (-) Transcript_14566:243-884(-)
MQLVIAVFAFVLVGFTVAQDTTGVVFPPELQGKRGPCVLNNLTEPIAVPGLQLCTEYRARSCCTLEQENEFTDPSIADFLILPTLGSDGCYENFRRALCYWVCNPDDRTFIRFTSADNFTINVAEPHAAKVYSSCSGRCIRAGTISETIRQRYADGITFLNSLTSSAVPGYTPSIDTPAQTYTLDDGGLNLVNDSELPLGDGSGTDLTGKNHK